MGKNLWKKKKKIYLNNFSKKTNINKKFIKEKNINR